MNYFGIKAAKYTYLEYTLDNHFNQIIFNTSTDWCILFFKNFFFELIFLLCLIFFILIKTTIIKKKIKITSEYSFIFYSIFIIIFYFLSNLIFIYLESFNYTALNYDPNLLAEYGRIIRKIVAEIDTPFFYEFTDNPEHLLIFLTQIQLSPEAIALNWQQIKFPVAFYSNFIISIFHSGFTFFYIFFFLFCLDYCTRLKINSSEIVLLLLLFLVFIRFLFCSYDFFALYLCLEGLTYIIYILILICSDKNLEITEHLHKNIFIKYFIYNGVSSLAILFSFASLFAITGSLKFSYLISCIKYFSILSYNYSFFFICIIFFLGFFFKLLVFPLFFWAQDFYENLPTFLFILLSTFYKVIIFCTFIKLIINFSYFSGTVINYTILLFFGFFTFFAGIFGALFASKIRIFLFYTSINQIGLLFIALGQLSHPPQIGLVISIFYYFFIYIITLFFFLISLYSCWINLPVNRPIEYFRDLQNLVKINPFIAILLSIFLFSFAGIPPFIGFFAKYELFLQIFNINSFFGLICIIGSVFSAFYYISIIGLFYFNKENSIFLYNSATFYKNSTLYSIKFDLNSGGFSILSYITMYFFLLFIIFNWLLPQIEIIFKLFLLEFILV